MSEQIDISSWSCPLPLQNYPTIVMGHGSGGKMMSDLIHHMFLPLLENDPLNQLGDSAVLEINPDYTRARMWLAAALARESGAEAVA